MKEDKEAQQSDPLSEDLVVVDDEKNWKGICIAIVVIASIVSLIVTAIIILTPADYGPRNEHPPLSLHDIVTEPFQNEKIDGQWISDNEIVYKNKNGALILFNASKNKTEIFVPNTVLKQIDASFYQVSSDRKYVLFTYSVKKIFEHSSLARYDVYETATGRLSSIEAPGGKKELQLADWGPQGNQLIFVHENNIYYYPSIGENLKSLVRNGKMGIIYNGIPDWLYGEKILKNNRAIWWSPSGRTLCFASFDDSKVDILAYLKYNFIDEQTSQSPDLISFRYPKAGRANPLVSVWVVNLTDSSNIHGPIRLLPPSEIINSDIPFLTMEIPLRDHYLTAVSWLDDEKLTVTWMRREHNYSVISLCTEDKKWICEKHLEKIMDHHNGWLEMFDTPIPSTDKKHYFVRISMKRNEKDTYKQIAKINIDDKVESFLTQGFQEVTKILGYGRKTNEIYFEATSADDPSERHIYKTLNNEHSFREPICLTCNQTDRNCSYQDALFSSSGEYFLLRCLGPGIPWTEIRMTSNSSIIRITSIDSEYIKILSTRAFPHVRYLHVPVADGFFAEVKLLLPPSLREDEEIKFPLVIETAQEPGSQQVTKRFSIEWGHYLASRRNFIYATIDTRGSRYKGDAFLHSVRNRIGLLEVQDYITVINYLRKEFHFIDSQRTAFWGWSYGGYVAGLALSMKTGINCSILVAPITNWLFVDSFTAERYLGQPWSQGSFVNYERSDLSLKALDFRNKNLFIIHGTADDNVQLQHSFSLMRALNEAGVVYRTQLYPDSAHSLEDVRYHLYRSMESFILDSFSLTEDEDIVEKQTAVKKKFGR